MLLTFSPIDLRRALAVVFALAALFLMAAKVRAGDDSDRDRKARVALALAGGSKSAVVAAPAPRLVTPKDYATGAKEARSDSKPLVVLVGPGGRAEAPGAVVARAETMPDVDGPATVVLYPVGEQLFVHATLARPVEGATLRAEVNAAAKKIDRPVGRTDKPAPVPLDWEIRTPTAPPAVCEDCECKTCPHCGKSLKEPVKPVKAKAELHISPDGTQNELHADGIWRAVPGAPKVTPPAIPARATFPAPSCSGSGCSTLPSYAPQYLPSYPFPTGGSSCPTGRCPVPR